MKNFKQYLKEDWWEDLSSEEQEAYIQAHPNSAKAKQAKNSSDNQKDKTTKSKIDPEIRAYAKLYGVSPRKLTSEAISVLDSSDEYSRSEMVDALVDAGVDYDTAEDIAANK